MAIVNRIALTAAGIYLFFALTSTVVGQTRNTPDAQPSISLAKARAAIEQAETSWARARVAVDKDAFEEALAPTFYAQGSDFHMTREEFLSHISNYPKGIKLTRFDNKVLTVEQAGDTSVGLVLEKLEFERQAENGQTATEYAMAVTRDGWKRFGDDWKALFSEVVGLERWKNGERPSMKDW